MYNSYFFSLFTAIFFSLSTTYIYGECQSKFDVAPAYMHLDVIVNNQTIQKNDMPAFRAEYSRYIKKGWWVKAVGLYGKNKAEFSGLTLATGFSLPIHEKILLSPGIGLSGSRFTTILTLPVHNPETDAFVFVKVPQKFEALSPYIGVEVAYKICQGTRLYLSVQYAWSYSEIKFQRLFKEKSDSGGPTFSLMLEHDLSNRWSVNIAGTYNESLSNQKDGLRGYGGKIGLAYWW